MNLDYSMVFIASLGAISIGSTLLIGVQAFRKSKQKKREAFANYMKSEGYELRTISFRGEKVWVKEAKVEVKSTPVAAQDFHTQPSTRRVNGESARRRESTIASPSSSHSRSNDSHHDNTSNNLLMMQTHHSTSYSSPSHSSSRCDSDSSSSRSGDSSNDSCSSSSSSD